MNQFKLSKLKLAQQKAGVKGKVGLPINMERKKYTKKPFGPLPTSKVKTGKRPKTQKNLTLRSIFETVRFKSARPDMLGRDAAKIPTKVEFLGEHPLVYDPFAHALGDNLDVSGANGGGDDFERRSQPETFVRPKFSIKKSTGTKLGRINHPDPFPAITLPNTQVHFRPLVSIKS